MKTVTRIEKIRILERDFIKASVNYCKQLSTMHRNEVINERNLAHPLPYFLFPPSHQGREVWGEESFLGGDVKIYVMSFVP